MNVTQLAGNRGRSPQPLGTQSWGILLSSMEQFLLMNWLSTEPHSSQEMQLQGCSSMLEPDTCPVYYPCIQQCFEFRPLPKKHFTLFKETKDLNSFSLSSTVEHLDLCLPALWPCTHSARAVPTVSKSLRNHCVYIYFKSSWLKKYFFFSVPPVMHLSSAHSTNFRLILTTGPETNTLVRNVATLNSMETTVHRHSRLGTSHTHLPNSRRKAAQF